MQSMDEAGQLAAAVDDLETRGAWDADVQAKASLRQLGITDPSAQGPCMKLQCHVEGIAATLKPAAMQWSPAY